MESTQGNITKLTLFSAAALITGACVVAWLIFSTEPEATREGASKKTPMLVDTIRVSKGRYQPLIVAMGEVIPEHQVELRAQVAGRVEQKAQAFAPGVFVEVGTGLLTIEKKEFELAVQQSLSDLLNAQAQMAIERGAQDAARAEYAQLKRKLSSDNKALVLREPELKIAQARLSAAEAAHERAKLDLTRSDIKAPLNAQVVEQLAGIGTLVNEGDSLGRLIGTDRYWVEVQVPMTALNWIVFDEAAEDEKPSLAKVRDRLAWPEGVFREASLHAAVGELNRQTRMARVLLEVEDPLNLKQKDASTPKLMPGAYVEAQIPAKALVQVVRLPREFLRQNNTVWVMQDKKLSIRKVEVAYQDPNYAYIAFGLEDNDEVVTSTLSRVRDGAELRLSADIEGSHGDSASSGANP